MTFINHFRHTKSHFPGWQQVLLGDVGEIRYAKLVKSILVVCALSCKSIFVEKGWQFLESLLFSSNDDSTWHIMQQPSILMNMIILVFLDWWKTKHFLLWIITICSWILEVQSVRFVILWCVVVQKLLHI